MSSVDDRIVNMQFNNKQFETGVSQSKASLETLEKSLQKTGQGKGLSEMANGVDTVRTRFSAMQVAGVAAIATIASKATTAGINLVKSFTLDPLTQGFQEYQTNLNSIQTIMANTGKSVKVVNGYLNQLNEYSDQTIYNFSEMARNIGTFTAAGVKLDTAVSAIQGISNIAALSGSSSQQASTAMYQLSQAIAAGRVNLQDWNSVVNAGMGGKNLQRALAQTGVAMGTVSADAVKLGDNIKIAGASFRESISAKTGEQSWLSSDVLVKTLSIMDGRLSKTAIANENLKWSTKQVNDELERQQKILKKEGFSDDQIKSLTKMANAAYESATVVKTLPQLIDVTKEAIGSVWAQAFTGIIGNFNESKKLWTSASNSVNAQITKFGQGLLGMITQWRKLGGRDAVIEGFKNGFTALGKVLGAVKDAFKDVFPPGAGKNLAALSKGFESFTAAMIPSESTLNSIRSIFGGVFAVLRVGLVVVQSIAGAFGAFFAALFSGSSGLRGGLLGMLGTVGEVIKGFESWVTSGGRVVNFFKTLGAIAGTVIKPLVSAVGLVAQAFAALLTGQGLSGFTGPLKEAGGIVAGFVATAASGLERLTAPFGWLSDIFGAIKDKALQLMDAFSPFGEAANTFANVSDAINGKLGGVNAVLDKTSAGADAVSRGFKGASDATSGAVDKMSGVVSDGFGKATDAMNKAKDAVAGVAQAFGDSGKAATTSGGEKMAATADTVGNGWERVKNVLIIIGSGLKTGFEALGKAASAIRNQFTQLFGGMDAIDWAAFTNAILGGALILAIKRSVDTFRGFGEAFDNVVEGITDSLGAMQNALKAQAIKAIAVAVALLVGSVIALTLVDPKKLAVGIGALASVMALAAGTLTALSKISTANNTYPAMAAALLALSVAMLNLAGAVILLGKQDLATLAKGLGAVAIAMIVMAGAVAALGKTKSVSLGASAALLAMAVSMNLIAGAVFLFGKMNMGTLAKGLGAMAVSIVLISAALAALGMVGPAVLAGGAAMFLVASAMVVLSGAVLAFGNMDLMTLAIGLGTMAAVLIIFAGALFLMGANAAGTLAAAASIAILVGALTALVPAIFALGSMDFMTLVKGIGALVVILGLFVAAIGALGVIAYFVGPGLILLGAALLLAGGGMLAFATGFAILATVGTAASAVLVAAFHALIAVLPSLGIGIAQAMTTFLETIAKASPRIRAAIGTIIKNFLGTVRDAIPEFGKTFDALLGEGIRIVQKNVPKFIEMGFTIIDEFLKSANKHIPKITESALELITRFLKAIEKNNGKVIDAGADLVIDTINEIARVIRERGDDLRRAGQNIATAIIDGLTGGLLTEGMDRVRRAAAAIADAIPGPIRSAMRINSPSKVAFYWGEMIGEGLAQGIYSKIRVVVGATVAMANALIAKGNDVIAAAQDKVRAAQAAADRKQADADATRFVAKRVKGKSKAAKAKRKALAKVARRQQKEANKAAKAAEKAQANFDRVEAFEAADLGGKGDFKASDSEENTQIAARLLAEAAAQMAASKRLRKKNRAASDALRKQAKKSAQQAKKFALKADKQRAQAEDYYSQEVDARIEAIEATRKAEEQALADQAELDAADAVGKAEILRKRAEANEAKAEAATKQALALIEEAKALSDTNAVRAMQLLDESEAAAEEAKKAADEAKAQREQAEQGSSGSGGSSNFQPSKSILEDAARAVDRYNASLQAATIAAQATQQPIQYVQNNYSPVALSASDIYRQSNNLLSLQEFKMGATK